MIRLGVIGLGKMGLSHLAIANSLGAFSVTWICDTNRLVGSAISRYVNARFTRDYREVCDNDEVDAVVVSVPTPLHFAMASNALRAGKHSFLEKPLTMTASQSEALVEAAGAARVYTQVGYYNRFNPVFAHLRRLLADKKYGDTIFYGCEMRGNVVGTKGAEGWRKDHASGGGCLYEYGSHCIDLALFLFGTDLHLGESKLISRVSSSVEDIVEAEVTHDSGINGRLYIDWCDTTYRKAGYKALAVTDRNVLVANKQELAIYDGRPDDPTSVWDYVEGREAAQRMYITDFDMTVEYYLRGEDFSWQLQAFGKGIAGQPTHAADFADGFRTDALIAEMMQKGSRVHG